MNHGELKNILVNEKGPSGIVMLESIDIIEPKYL